jgi:putative heme iron utilization protein
VHKDGSPLASFSPYAVDSDQASFWILVSDVDSHAQNLDRTLDEFARPLMRVDLSHTESIEKRSEGA